MALWLNSTGFSASESTEETAAAMPNSQKRATVCEYAMSLAKMLETKKIVASTLILSHLELVLGEMVIPGTMGVNINRDRP